MFMKNSHATKSESRVIRTDSIYGISIFLLLALALLGELQGQVNATSGPVLNGEQAKASQVAVPTRAEDYVIGPDDLLNVYVLDVPELSRDYRVSAVGTITIPVLANPLNAAGLTLSEFSKLLSQELKAQGLVSDPHITMAVDQSRLHTVAIVGSGETAANLSGLKPNYSAGHSFSGGGSGGRCWEYCHRAPRRNCDQGFAQKGGAAASPEQSQADTLTLDLRRLLESGDPSLNIDIYPGDRITVPRAGVVYVVGAVNKPGGFAMKPSTHGMTVLQAIALAEDTKTTALRDQTVIIRNDPQAPEGRKQIPVDLKAILRGKSSDPVLQAEDILFIPDSSGKRALQSGHRIGGAGGHGCRDLWGDALLVSHRGFPVRGSPCLAKTCWFSKRIKFRVKGAQPMSDNRYLAPSRQADYLPPPDGGCRIAHGSGAR